MKDNKALGFVTAIRNEIQLMVRNESVTSDYGCELDQMLSVIEQALTKEVSKDTNVEEVEEIFTWLRLNTLKIVRPQLEDVIKTIRNYIEQHSFNVPKENDNQFLDNFKRTGTKIICNEDGSVDVEEPTKSAKDMFEKLGYMCFGYNSNIIKYDKYGVSYVFFKDKNNKHFYTISLNEDNSREYIISMEEHQAITQQLKELEE